jgi:hypothetical protein
MGLRDILSRSVGASLPQCRRSKVKDRHYQSGYASAKRGCHALARGLGSKYLGADCEDDHRSQPSIHLFMIKAVDLQIEFVGAHFP